MRTLQHDRTGSFPVLSPSFERTDGPSSPSLSLSHLDHGSLTVPFVVIVNLAPHGLAIGFVRFAALDQKFWTVARAAEVALEVFPATVWLEGAPWVDTTVWTERLDMGISTDTLWFLP